MNRFELFGWNGWRFLQPFEGTFEDRSPSLFEQIHGGIENMEIYGNFPSDSESTKQAVHTLGF